MQDGVSTFVWPVEEIGAVKRLFQKEKGTVSVEHGSKMKHCFSLSGENFERSGRPGQKFLKDLGLSIHCCQM